MQQLKTITSSDLPMARKILHYTSIDFFVNNKQGKVSISVNIHLADLKS